MIFEYPKALSMQRIWSKDDMLQALVELIYLFLQGGLYCCVVCKFLASPRANSLISQLPNINRTIACSTYGS